MRKCHVLYITHWCDIDVSSIFMSGRGGILYTPSGTYYQTWGLWTGSLKKHRFTFCAAKQRIHVRVEGWVQFFCSINSTMFSHCYILSGTSTHASALLQGACTRCTSLSISGAFPEFIQKQMFCVYTGQNYCRDMLNRMADCEVYYMPSRWNDRTLFVGSAKFYGDI
jgi:hypothetical protein